MYYNRSLHSTRLIPNSDMQQPLVELWQLEIQHKQHAVPESEKEVESQKYKFHNRINEKKHNILRDQLVVYYIHIVTMPHHSLSAWYF